MMDAFNITDANRKKALLLHYAGEDVFSVYTTLDNYDTLNFENLCIQLDAYFNPRKCIEFEVHKFRKTTQKEEESLDDFHTRLQLTADGCEFKDKELEIKMQIIQKCRSNKLRKRALQQPMSLQALLKFGRSLEMAASQAEEMIVKEENITKISKENKENKSYKNVRGKHCFRCGGSWPHDGQCPAMGKKCNKCHKINHFSKVCKTKQINQIQEEENTSLSSNEEEYI